MYVIGSIGITQYTRPSYMYVCVCPGGVCNVVLSVQNSETWLVRTSKGTQNRYSFLLSEVLIIRFGLCT